MYVYIYLNIKWERTTKSIWKYQGWQVVQAIPPNVNDFRSRPATAGGQGVDALVVAPKVTRNQPLSSQEVKVNIGERYDG